MSCFCRRRAAATGPSYEGKTAPARLYLSYGEGGKTFKACTNGIPRPRHDTSPEQCAKGYITRGVDFYVYFLPVLTVV